jgi:hypothetical protein
MTRESRHRIAAPLHAMQRNYLKVNELIRIIIHNSHLIPFLSLSPRPPPAPQNHSFALRSHLTARSIRPDQAAPRARPRSSQAPLAPRGDSAGTETHRTAARPALCRLHFAATTAAQRSQRAAATQCGRALMRRPPTPRRPRPALTARLPPRRPHMGPRSTLPAM